MCWLLLVTLVLSAHGSDHTATSGELAGLGGGLSRREATVA
ncbi:hypothetical protein SynA1560_01425 [Synechococcus sp. A15-60]|nr:hypothetical protein SynA1560_01425 [Synechococcus sp. A15-60]